MCHGLLCRCCHWASLICSLFSYHLMTQTLPIQLNTLQITLEMHLLSSKTKNKWNTINIPNDRKVSGSFYKIPVLTFLSLLSINPTWSATPKWPLAVYCLTRELWCFQRLWDSPDLTLKMHSVSSSRKYLFVLVLDLGGQEDLKRKKLLLSLFTLPFKEPEWNPSNCPTLLTC